MFLRFSLLVSLAWITHSAYAQILYADSAILYVASNAVVFSNGGVELTQSTAFTNEGTLTVTKNSTFPAAGNFSINTSSVVNGNGNYRVEQDWINDAQFVADASSVELYGNTLQNITSNNATVTTFNQLKLTGTGTGNNRKKRLQNANAGIGVIGILTINDRELATESNTFFVLNPSIAAVTNSLVSGSEGFVSSLVAGYFSRVTNTMSSYTFPTGSSVGTLRYRPVTITPTNISAGAYNVRLNNYDANTDAFDRTSLADDVCTTNNIFYHSIIRSAGTSSADVSIYYLPAADGNWAHIAHWKTSNSQWNNTDPNTTGTSSGFSTVTKTNWIFPDVDHPYILATTRPLPPSIVSCPSLCENSVGQFTATGSGSGYQWSVPNGVGIQSGQGTNNVSVQWGNNSGYVKVIALGAGGCNSLPDSCMPQIFLNPTADFTYASNDEYNSTIQFEDNSLLAAQWNWDFGDGGSSLLTSPQYSFQNTGIYHVLLTVTSKDGCTAKSATTITVEGDNVYIPNTFTPDGDGLNDGFRPINRSGEAVSFMIFNRWGQQIYASEDPKAAWNGTYGGKPCPLDVYVCKVEYKDSKGASKMFIGQVNLIK